MLEALIGTSWQRVDVIGVGHAGVLVAFGKGKMVGVPLNRFRWVSDDYHEESRRKVG